VPAAKDNAICLRLLDWSETSQIAVLLTEHHGKISAVAKGAKRQQPSVLAKFSGGLELLSAGEAVLILKRHTELNQLTEWDLHDPHWHLRRTLPAYRLAMYAADLLHHVVHDHDPHPGAYQALRTFLAELADPAQRHSSLLRFQWRIVEEMGLRPVLERDAETGGKLDEAGDSLAFSASAGGVVSDTGASDRWRVRRGTVQLLRDVAGGRSWTSSWRQWMPCSTPRGRERVIFGWQTSRPKSARRGGSLIVVALPFEPPTIGRVPGFADESDQLCHMPVVPEGCFRLFEPGRLVSRALAEDQHVRPLEGLDRLGVELVPLEPDRIERSHPGRVPVADHIRRTVVDHPGHPADEGVAADGHEVAHSRRAADDGVVVDLDVPGEHDVVGQDAVRADV